MTDNNPRITVDVYSVGILADLQHIAHTLTGRAQQRVLNRYGMVHPGFVRRNLRTATASIRRNWRRRSAWNGYLAEPSPLPWGLTTVGHGWTKRRALARLGYYLYESSR